MTTFSDTVEDATHAAFHALGLSPECNVDLAIELNEYLRLNFQHVVTSDFDDQCLIGTRSPAIERSVAGQHKPRHPRRKQKLLHKLFRRSSLAKQLELSRPLETEADEQTTRRFRNI